MGNEERDYTEEVRIQTRDVVGMLSRATERFMARTDVSEVNKQLVGKFLREAALGKTVVGRARKQIGPDRRHLYLTQLSVFVDQVRKDLDKVGMEDMERFIEALDGGKITSRRATLVGRGRVVNARPLSPRYCSDI